MTALPPIVLGNAFTDIRPGLTVWTWIIFLIVAWLLKRYAWGPLMQAVATREQNISQAIDAAKRERKEAEKLLADQQELLAKSRQEAADAVRETRAELERFREGLVAQARADADALKAEGRKAIAEERTRASLALRAEAVALSIQVAEKLLETKLDSTQQRQLAQRFIDELSKAQPTKN